MNEEPTQPPQAIFAQMLGIMHDIGTITKTGRNSFQNYAYLTADDVNAKLQPLLIKWGVVMQCAFSEPRPAEVDKGFHYTTLLTVTFWAVKDASYLSCCFPGEGADTGDKAIPKACTAAFKTAIQKTFCISDGSDSEVDSPVLTAKKTPFVPPQSPRSTTPAPPRVVGK